MIPTQKQIDYFLALCTSRTISEAAKRLFVTQPALSRALDNLEAQLGATLFNRTRPLSLTDAGESFHIYVKKLRQLEWEHHQEFMAFKNTNARKRFGIGTLPFLGSYILPSIVPAFSKAHPDLQVHIDEANGRFIEQILLDKEIDLVLSNLPPVSKELRFKRLADDPFMVVSRANSGEEGFEELKDFAILNGKTFLLLKPWQNIRKVSDRVFLSENIIPGKTIEVQSISASLSLIMNYDAYAFTTYSALNFIRPQIPLKCYLLNKYSDITGIVALYRPDTDSDMLNSFCNMAKSKLNALKAPPFNQFANK